MFQIRIHGRGGQGAVTAAEVLSVAAFRDGLHAQAFPAFGSERMGAPVMAFCRIDQRPIRLREPIMDPDALIIQDASLLSDAALLDGLKPDGWLLINSEHPADDASLHGAAARVAVGRARTLPATVLALEHLRRPTPNIVLLGGFVALTRIVKIESLADAIRERFPGSMGEANVRASQAAYERLAAAAPAVIGKGAAC